MLLLPLHIVSLPGLGVHMVCIWCAYGVHVPAGPGCAYLAAGVSAGSAVRWPNRVQVDAWAVGILCYELMVGYPPFEQESRAATYEHIMYKVMDALTCAELPLQGILGRQPSCLESQPLPASDALTCAAGYSGQAARLPSEPPLPALLPLMP